MTDLPVYMIANLVIQDAAEYRVYEKGFFPILKRHGGEFVTYDDRPQNLRARPRARDDSSSSGFRPRAMPGDGTPIPTIRRFRCIEARGVILNFSPWFTACRHAPEAAPPPSDGGRSLPRTEG